MGKTKYSAKPEDLWRRQKAKLKLYFPQLNDDDFRYDYGMKDVMMTKLQVRLGKSREELTALLTQL
jgi:hypothetical protein